MSTTLSLLSAPAVASLALLTGGRASRSSSGSCLSFSKRSSRFPSPLLHSCFIAPSDSSLSFPSSSLSGLSLGVDFCSSHAIRDRRCGLVVRAGKAALCLTKRSRSRKSLARTHGFRRRMMTTSGRAVLKRRRAKGRKVLCTKSNPNNGKWA